MQEAQDIVGSDIVASFVGSEMSAAIATGLHGEQRPRPWKGSMKATNSSCC